MSGHERAPEADRTPEVLNDGKRHHAFPGETPDQRRARLAPEIGKHAVRGAQQPTRVDPADPRLKNVARTSVREAARTPRPERMPAPDREAPPEDRARDRDAPREDRER